MSREGDPSLNVFVRFKQRVDSNISSGLHTLLGIPQQPHQPPSPSPSITPDQADLTISERSESTSPSIKVPNSPYITMDNAVSRPSTLDAFSVASWSYAPSNLRHLRQPVPKDLPPQYDATIFTFEDAFEDLLAVSQGNPLPDISTKYSQKSLLRHMFPSGEPTWFWFRRLESQGLLRRPGRDEILSRQLEAELLQPHWPDWSRFHRELDGNTAEVWRNVATTEADDRQSTGDFFDEIHKTLKQLEGGFAGRRSEAFEGQDSKDYSQRRRLPDHFDDLFSAVDSGFTGGQKTWDTFLKTISENKRIPSDKNDQPVARINDDGSKEVVTRDEHVDRFGYLRTKITRKTFDKEGNEIGSETNFTMRPAEKKRESNAGKEGNDAHVIERTDSDTDNEQTQDKKAGWFWK